MGRPESAGTPPVENLLWTDKSSACSHGRIFSSSSLHSGGFSANIRSAVRWCVYHQLLQQMRGVVQAGPKSWVGRPTPVSR
jgi:hypothetical protein